MDPIVNAFTSLLCDTIGEGTYGGMRADYRGYQLPGLQMRCELNCLRFSLPEISDNNEVGTPVFSVEKESPVIAVPTKMVVTPEGHVIVDEKLFSYNENSDGTSVDLMRCDLKILTATYLKQLIYLAERANIISSVQFNGKLENDLINQITDESFIRDAENIPLQVRQAVIATANKAHEFKALRVYQI